MMKRRGFTLLQAICLITILIIAAVAILPVFMRSTGSGNQRSACQSNLKQIGLAASLYSQDYDEVLLSAKNSNRGLTSPDNWAGKLYPYVKSTQVFGCPQDLGVALGERCSYGYNARLSKLPMGKVSEPEKVINFFEVNADPNNWTQTGRGPQAITASTRHMDGSNFAFADGHVKWLKSGEVGVLSPDKGEPTFVPR